MEYAIEMASRCMTNLISFTKIYTGVQAILRFCLRHLRGCNAGITDRRDLLSKLMGWLPVV
jgi:hypothetical protein